MAETGDAFVHAFFLAGPGPRPPYREVAHHLWGEGCDVDSDGNSEPDPATPDWTELTVILRPGETQRIDVDPIVDEEHGQIRPLILIVTSQNEALARKAAHFLRDRCGGRLTRGAGGPQAAGRADWPGRFCASLPE
jgi:hypothetical protein